MPATKRAEAKAATRARVLEAARLAFERDGYEAATIREIAHIAQRSTGAVFSNFSGKAELYEAVYGHPPITPEQGREYLLALQATQAKAA